MEVQPQSLDSNWRTLLGNGFIREEALTLTRSSRISFDASDSDGLGNGDILLEDGSMMVSHLLFSKRVMKL